MHLAPFKPYRRAVMSQADEADSASVASVRSSKRSLSVVGGPTEIHGRVFLCIKRCPLCILTNADDTPIPRGPWGPEYSTTLPWARGTAEKPEGRYDKICVGAWDLGGFGIEYKKPDHMIEARKSDDMVGKIWEATQLN